MKKTKGQKGITIIALIITIVVLLIIAVVAIRSIQENGAIAQTENATNKYIKAQSAEEKMLLEYEYQLASIQNSNIGTYEEYFLENRYGLKIGDYVNYTYDTVSSGYSLSKIYSGNSGNQTIAQSSGLQWRVLGLDENGNIELICATPAKRFISFKGAAAYNNGVYLLNDICAKLYGNQELNIKARSLTIEDIEEKFSSAGKSAITNYTNSNTNTKYGATKTYNTNNKYPLLYAEEVGSGVNGTIREGGIGKSEPFYNNIENLTMAYDSAGTAITTSYTTAKDSDGNNVALNATDTYYTLYNTPKTYFENETFYDMIFGTGTYYWIASRYVRLYSDYTKFGLTYVSEANLYGYGMFSSNGEASGYHYYLRPVVSIPSDIMVDTTTGNGTAGNAYGLSKAK